MILLIKQHADAAPCLDGPCAQSFFCFLEAVEKLLVKERPGGIATYWQPMCPPRNFRRAGWWEGG